MTSSDLWDAETAARYDESTAFMFTPEVLDPAVSFLAGLAGDGAALELAIGTGRPHHRLKQRRRWTYHLAPNGTATWTSPTGKRRISHADHAAVSHHQRQRRHRHSRPWTSDRLPSDQRHGRRWDINGVTGPCPPASAIWKHQARPGTQPTTALTPTRWCPAACS